jgi:hypothetical protein
MSATDDDKVFDYREGGDSAPLDVVRVRVDPSVTSIPACAFYGRKKLTEVEYVGAFMADRAGRRSVLFPNIQREAGR